MTNGYAVWLFVRFGIVRKHRVQSRYEVLQVNPNAPFEPPLTALTTELINSEMPTINSYNDVMLTV